MTSDLRNVHVITFSNFSAMTVADARGLFAVEGLTVQITPTPNSTEQMRGLSEGRYDIAATAFDNVLAWSGREGAQIKAVAQASHGVFLPVYVRPEIKDWEDLRGRKLAVDAVDTAFALVLRRVLLEHGLDMDKGDYELVPEGATGPRFESMQRGDTFAGILNRPWDRSAEEAGMSNFGGHEAVLPDYPGTVFAVTSAWAGERKRDLVGFLRAIFTAAAWMSDPANQDEAAEVMASQADAGKSATLTNMGELVKDGVMNIDGLRSVLDLRLRFGLTPPMGSDIASYVDTSFRDEALRP